MLYHENARSSLDVYVRQGLFTQLGILLSTVVHMYIVGRKKGLGTNLAMWGEGGSRTKQVTV